MYESVAKLPCGKVTGNRVWGGVEKCAGVWGEVRNSCGGVEKCGGVYGVSGKVCLGCGGEV